VFAVMPSLVALQILHVMFVHSMPMILRALLVIVLISSVALSIIAIDQLIPPRIEIDPDSLTSVRVFGRQKWTWRDIQKVSIVSAKGTLSDSLVRSSVGRVGVGLLLKSAAETRDGESEADALLISGSVDEVDKLQMIVEIVERAQKRAMGGNMVTQRRIAPSGVKAAGEFRRPRKLA